MNIDLAMHSFFDELEKIADLSPELAREIDAHSQGAIAQAGAPAIRRGQRLRPGVAGDYSPQQHTVRLTPDAGRSTLYHELGHSWNAQGLPARAFASRYTPALSMKGRLFRYGTPIFAGANAAQALSSDASPEARRNVLALGTAATMLPAVHTGATLGEETRAWLNARRLSRGLSSDARKHVLEGLNRSQMTYARKLLPATLAPLVLGGLAYREHQRAKGRR